MVYPVDLGRMPILLGKERVYMKTQLADKDLLTVQEAVEHFQLSRRKFYEVLHEEGHTFLAFYFDHRRLIIVKEFEKYLEKHPEIRRRGC